MSADVSKNVEQFGGKAKITRHHCSEQWEIPIGTCSKFVRILNARDRFEAKLDLEYFTAFRPEEIDVSVSGYDLHIYADRENPNNPNYSSRRLQRQYRLPDDTDLRTIKLHRETKTSPEVGVQARKISQYGKPISFAIVDVTRKHRPYAVVKTFS